MRELVVLIRAMGVGLCVIALADCGAAQRPGGANELLAGCTKQVGPQGAQYRCTDVIARVVDAPGVAYDGALERYRDSSEAINTKARARDYCGHEFTKLKLGGEERRVLILKCSDHSTHRAAEMVDLAVAMPLQHGARIVSCAFEHRVPRTLPVLPRRARNAQRELTADEQQYQMRQEHCEEILQALVLQNPASAPSSAPSQ